MKPLKTLTLLCVLFAGVVHAEMPYINNNTASERTHIQNGDITCDVDKPKSTINAGVYGSNSNDHYYGQENDKGGYVGISIPIGGSDNTVDCNRLYDLSVKEKELKIKQLEEQVKTLQKRTLSVEE